MSNMNDYIKARTEYVALIKKELLGPGSELSIPDEEHELISTSPEKRYSVGILYPQDIMQGADNDDTARVEEAEEDIDIEDDTEDDVGIGSKKDNINNPGEEDNLDEEIGLSSQNMPSSLGIAFFTRGNSERVRCRVSFATYRNPKREECCLPYYPDNPDEFEIPQEISLYIKYDKENKCLKLGEVSIDAKGVGDFQRSGILDEDFGLFDALYKLINQYRHGYVRVPHTEELTLDFSGDNYIDNNKDICGTKAKVTALRRQMTDDTYSITLMLVNNNKNKRKKGNCLFQPEIRVRSCDNDFVFADITSVNYADNNTFLSLDDEEQSLEMQYRNKLSYGTGLGTSVNWDIDAEGNGEIFSDFFPQNEVPQMNFNLPEESGVEPKALSMKYLSDLNEDPIEEKILHLRSLVNAYGVWIETLEEKAKTIDEKYSRIAAKNIKGCKESFRRMTEGIEKIESDETVAKAFLLANRAMFMQRVQLSLQPKRDVYPYDDELSDILDSIDYRNDEVFTADRYFWRPFQIAFLLMSIVSIVDEKSEDRETVDLIWFPTGGGKTEAYLGLTAFTIFYRRLAHLTDSDGTAVIMRYTLRLLAAQQFTRAATLICACEYIRQDSLQRRPVYKAYPLGKKPITIGLWIGGEHTPNTNAEAKTELNILTKSNYANLKENKDKHNKFQVLKCPWCGTKLVMDCVDKKLIGEFGYVMRNNSHFELHCPQENCYFNPTVLPIQIIDEELYLNPPALLFGTVDKFAMLPWKKEIGNFFGLNGTHRAPELIIQDELHLISGPLGTMVGLYESAIDYLCSSKGIKTKIVASTATIRRANDQCSALYDRNVSQFPHPGLDAEDSFFARELTVDYNKGKFGRLYVGLMPSGKTKAMMEVRSIAALMQMIHSMPLDEQIKDKYWTLTVYFNSLKDLGKCNTLVEDDVKDFIKRIVRRLSTDKYARTIAFADELTSRVTTTELNETLDKLEKTEYSEENIKNKKYASSILLASNMISVGIDVDRLNVMMLVGQPKLTSEYIQASSRVGRKYPGVAFTLYDGSKSRDRSHYEQFRSYHESFYKNVEPTGATPFSQPARDRALNAVVIALVRHLIPELSDEKDASGFSIEKYNDVINKIKTFIINREQSVLARLDSDIRCESEKIAAEIQTLAEDWERMAQAYDSDKFWYGEKYLQKHPEEGFGRLMKPYSSVGHDASEDIMTSMRNVDAVVPGNVLIWEE